MIQNELQYRVTKTRLREFQETQQNLEQDGIKGKALEVRRKAVASMIAELSLELEAFQATKTQGIPSSLGSLEQIPDDLIKARIAAGFTQASLAKTLHLKPQQIQRYEATKYASASLARVLEVARVLQDRAK
jgi:DNA-binding XRE family transcriptional regulator